MGRGLTARAGQYRPRNVEGGVLADAALGS
jgi:hypothetical protein